jgi:hypothetical protein
VALLSRLALAAVLLRPEAGPAPAAALAAALPTEYEVKAAYLYNFAKFVEWPQDAFKDGSAPFVIAVVGRDPFGAALDQILAGKSVNGHPVEVLRVSDPDQARGAHIVYVGSADGGSVTPALRRVSGDGVLTVGDGEDFAARGGIIGFRTQDRRVRFDINAQRAERAGLKLSSQLLKLARIVGENE